MGWWWETNVTATYVTVTGPGTNMFYTHYLIQSIVSLFYTQYLPQAMVSMFSYLTSCSYLLSRDEFISRKYKMEEMYQMFVEGDDAWKDIQQVKNT